MNTEVWANKHYKETLDFWKSEKSKYKFSNKGFAIFYSPIKVNPELMIVGFNPGGDEKSFNIENALILPKSHDYFENEKDQEDYSIAKQMKNLFNTKKLNNLLRNSVKLNLYFFRSSGEEELYSANNINDLKKFSEEKFKEIYKFLKPKCILTEGIGTYDKICQLLDCKNSNIIIKDENYKILCRNENEKLTVIGLIHPSGLRTRNRFDRNFDKIQKCIKMYFKDN